MQLIWPAYIKDPAFPANKLSIKAKIEIPLLIKNSQDTVNIMTVIKEKRILKIIKSLKEV